MGYYHRYLFKTPPQISLADLEDKLQAVQPSFEIINRTKTESGASAELIFQNELYAMLDWENIPENDEEIEELKEEIEDGEGDADFVLHFLNQTKQRLVLQILWQNRSVDKTMKGIFMFWEVIFALDNGLLQADNEGYYTKTGFSEDFLIYKTT